MKTSHLVSALVLGIVLANACNGSGSSGDNGGAANGGSAGGSASLGGTSSLGGGDNGLGGGNGGDGVTAAGGSEQGHGLVVSPATKALVFQSGKPAPTQQFAATLDGQPVNAGWSVDQGALAAVNSGGLLTATGKAAGTVKVIAAVGKQQASATVTISLQLSENGFDQTKIPADTGGGINGVGGEGPGVAATASQVTVLTSAPTASGAPTWLYPYDNTVWPRSLLAPLLQWQNGAANPEAIAMHLETKSKSFVYDGTFGLPSKLAAGAPFQRHPITQDAWQAATDSASATDPLTISLVFAAGGKAYGPITETWTVAPARLAGTVYYNSYGTQLVQNSGEPGNHKQGPAFGAAVLSIKAGDLGPSVVAGTQSGDKGGCRVCHVVAAGGSKLIVQDGSNYAQTWEYDLKNGNAATALQGGDFAWAGLAPDASMLFANAADLAASSGASAPFMLATTPTKVTSMGLPDDLMAGAPSFSPDGKHVAFDFMGGTIGSTTGDGKKLVALDYDAGAQSFSGLKVLLDLATQAPGKDYRAGFPSFLPTNDAVLFHYQVVNSNHRYNTWQGAQAQIWWSDLTTGTPHALNALNGLKDDGTTSYLPAVATGTKGDESWAQADHSPDLDTNLNYEPTVLPVVSGGFAWVVFTSRRPYGTVATNSPWLSDPRDYDTSKPENTTTKKLWVAAIDLNAKAGTDPSHPAFYLPAQEILAGNARGFWVLDPCRADALPCDSGDECCGGYCQSTGTNGALVCSNKTNTCAMNNEKCTKASDCCDGAAQCINDFCAVPASGIH